RNRVHRARRALGCELRERPRRRAAGEDRGPPAGDREVTRTCGVAASRAIAAVFAAAVTLPAQAQFHRAEQDREITYWLLAPETHQFKISHDFTVTREGQKSVHSFVRKGSTVEGGARVFDLDTGQELKTVNKTGKEVNALGYYPEPTEDDSVVVEAELPKP